VKSLKELQSIDVQKVANAIELDAGVPMAKLRQALEEASKIELQLDEDWLNFPGPDPDSSR